MKKVIWITGLVDSGKTTIALALQKKIANSIVLDAQQIRQYISCDLTYTAKDRRKNVLRTGGMAKILFDQGFSVIVALISPIRKDREEIRKLFNPGDFFEVYNNTPLKLCALRDTKGLYKKEKDRGFWEKLLRISKKSLPGSSSIYEPPLGPEQTINTKRHSLEECVDQILVRSGFKENNGPDHITN